jgi:hypothetical protein
MDQQQIQQQKPAEAQNLATVVSEWRRISDEIITHKQQVSEKGKRAKVLEGIILTIMKQQNHGALDLKNSGGRILYQKKEGNSAIYIYITTLILTDN